MSNKEIHRYVVTTVNDTGLMSFCRADLPKGAKVINASTTWPHDCLLYTSDAADD